MKLIKVKAKSIFTKSGLPGADWVINQYVGCQHACLYCYAKFIARWRPSSYGTWGKWQEAKINAPELVKGKYVKGSVFMSSISDPYPPIEKELKLTQKVLKNLDKRIDLSIQTKSDLILRDIDLLKEFKHLEIGFTINDFEGNLKKLFEPGSPSNERRIKALKILNKAGFKTYAFVSPIIPYITDLKGIIDKTKDFSDYYWFEILNLRGAGREFALVLEKKYPESYKILKDKEEFSKFVKDCRKIISSKKIKVQGIEVHG